MPDPDLIELFAKPLGEAGIRHLITGSVAAILYGEPRFTNDIDFIAVLRAGDVVKLAAIFPTPAFYVPPASVIFEEMARPQRGHFNLIHVASGLKADIYPASRDELHGWAFRHRRKYTIGTNTISLAPPEYIIIRKLEYYLEGGSEKHLRDIRTILSVSGAQLDNAALNEWIARLNLSDLWRRVVEGS